MPLYEYYCTVCKTRFEMLRPMGRAAEPATCPSGHANAERVVSLIAARVATDTDAFESMGGGCGGCAGGACACGGH
jgi:putative FmdB family regulatory protein